LVPNEREDRPAGPGRRSRSRETGGIGAAGRGGGHGVQSSRGRRRRHSSGRTVTACRTPRFSASIGAPRGRCSSPRSARRSPVAWPSWPVRRNARGLANRAGTDR